MSWSEDDLNQLKVVISEVVEAKLGPVQESVEVVKTIAKDSTFRLAKIEHATSDQLAGSAQ
ncbi:hypothetical protein KY386_01550 [Candidatus Parcubacteria bacterium]|nr:hypothetical protein [Candidatus Parcubacteria bacterium]